MDLIKKNKKEIKNGDWGVLWVWVAIKKRVIIGFACALVTLKWGPDGTSNAVWGFPLSFDAWISLCTVSIYPCCHSGTWGSVIGA